MIAYSTVSSPSIFSATSRPIYLYPIADVTNKNKEEAWPRLAEGVREICQRNPINRVLIHTVSYELTNYLASNLSYVSSLKSRLVYYTRASERQRSLDLYLLTPDAIFLAPSLDRGIDLPDDDCRAIVVCKVPYPNLADKQISARLHSFNGDLWYRVQTVRTLVQMTGRGMRHRDDYCESYILDKQFVSNVWKRSQGLLPQWWKEALIWDAGRLI